MLINPPPKKQNRRRYKNGAPAKAPPAPLTLTAADASISDDKSQVSLTFDRDVDISAINVAAITVGTISTGNLYQGTGATVFAGSLVLIDLVVIDTYPYTNVILFADADNGIVAVDDGGTWAGTGGLNLPFP